MFVQFCRTWQLRGDGREPYFRTPDVHSVGLVCFVYKQERNLISVSYTHLDVYKRQIVRGYVQYYERIILVTV